MQGARSLSLVFKNNDSLFSSSTELGLTLDSRLPRVRRGKEGRRHKSRMCINSPVCHHLKVASYLIGTDPLSPCPPTHTPK